MFLRAIVDERLAQVAYLVGCQKSGEAIVFDAERDVDRYVGVAAANGLRIVAAAETHIHADFLSGTRELGERGARVYVSGEGGRDWQYGWLDAKSGGGSYSHQLVRDGDVFTVGKIEFRVMHTPGHTPEHVCYLVTDRGGGASEPMGVISGDFVFVGDLGRPDLLETAMGGAGVKGAKDASAHELFKSVRRFVELPDYLQVWPGHGAGSACGKALGAVPQTTVGYEKRVSPAIAAAREEKRFVDFILAGQPEPPLYFARMKRWNRDGAPLLGERGLPKPRRVILDAQWAATRTFADSGPASRTSRVDAPGPSSQTPQVRRPSAVIVDTRAWKVFREGHVAGSIFAPVDGSFHSVVGSYVEETEAIHLIAEEGRVGEIVRELVRIGLDRVVAFSTPGDVEEWRVREGEANRPGRAGYPGLARIEEVDVAGADARIEKGEVFVLDVRRADEFEHGHIPGALHVAYPRLPEHLREIPRDRAVLVNCLGGGRSARACAYLARKGYRVMNLGGGYSAWSAGREFHH